MLNLKTILSLTLCVGIYQIGQSQCTPGAITQTPVNPPYITILDQNSDGFITSSGAAFVNGIDEMSEFEAVANSVTGWVEIQDVSEVSSDITPNCGNPDLIIDDDGGDFAFYNIIDPTPLSASSGDEYIVLRFRLAKSPNGNFGYNFLFDTDAMYGSGVDPNAICGNRGFEREIQFANAGGRKGVSAYDVDGSTALSALSPACSQCVDVNDIQEACAASSGGCMTSDPQFITFGLPLSHVGISSDYSTDDLYISVATASSGNATSVLGGGNVTDFGAIDGNNVGCPDCVGLNGCSLFDCQTNCIYDAFAPALPVELLEFTAIRTNKNVGLKWRTATETNNSYFEVEHSTDGEHFRKLGIIRGRGTTTQTESYSYTHHKPADGVNYYRLKQVDLDGQFSYSKIIVLEYLQDNNLNIRPVLATNYIQLETEYDQSIQSLVVFDSTGKLVKQISSSESSQIITVSIDELPKGQYFIQAQLESKVITKRFVKIN